MKLVRYLSVFFVGFLFLHGYCQGQTKNDTIPSFIKGKTGSGAPVAVPDSALPKGRKRVHTDAPYKVDSTARKQHSPRKATLYSTFVPGLGQIYNRKYWKLPLVYAAVGIPAYTFFYNRSWYKKCQDAIALIDPYTSLGQPVPEDVYNKVDPRLREFAKDGAANSIRSYRNEFRKDQDYSVLFFLLFWGLQIVDATVDAHLMSFDVSDKLTFHLQQSSNGLPITGSGSSGGMGIGLA
ncbi:MAG: hypothetical protein JST68_05070, partial [Bacteroidetes bacterium]|nr:hypothetical protein [Bacteroidota bacterium]